jgi:hypothetical protein
MMSTLFIGQQDFTLKAFLAEHATDAVFWIEVAGVVFIASLVLAMLLYVAMGKKSTSEYTPVALNELKSKAQD